MTILEATKDYVNVGGSSRRGIPEDSTKINARRLETVDITLWSWSKTQEHITEDKGTIVAFAPPRVYKLDFRIYMTAERSRRLVDLIHIKKYRMPRDLRLEPIAQAIQVKIRDIYPTMGVPKFPLDVFDLEPLLED